MSDDRITVSGQSHDNAVLLLEAAQALDVDPSEIRTTESGFDVPAEVGMARRRIGQDNLVT